MYIVVMQSQTQRKAEQAISSAIWRGGGDSNWSALHQQTDAC